MELQQALRHLCFVLEEALLHQAWPVDVLPLPAVPPLHPPQNGKLSILLAKWQTTHTSHLLPLSIHPRAMVHWNPQILLHLHATHAKKVALGRGQGNLLPRRHWPWNYSGLHARQQLITGANTEDSQDCSSGKHPR